MIADRVYDLVTDDLFLRLPEFIGAPRVFAKVEGLNPAGSVKLKTAVALIADAEKRGLLSANGRVVESSYRKLGVALSIVCANKGYSFTCITDPKASPQCVATMRALSANVVVVTERDGNGGYLATRIAHIKKMLSADPGLVWPNQYANAANPRVHWERTAAPDSQGDCAGRLPVRRSRHGYFRSFSPDTRIIAVDTRGSVTFGRPPGPRYIPGIGNSRRVPELCRTDNLDAIVHIEEADAVRACRRVAAEHGLLIGGSSGSVLAAVMSMRSEIPADSNVVAISPDLGDPYLDSIYDGDWVTGLFGPDVLAGRQQCALKQLRSLDAEWIGAGTRFAARTLDVSAYLEVACAQHNLETAINLLPIPQSVLAAL